MALQTPRKYSNHAYWNKDMVQNTVDAGFDALKLDVVYSFLIRKIYVSNYWRPFPFMYCGSLEKRLNEIRNFQDVNSVKKREIKYIIIEVKSIFLPKKKLFKLLDRFCFDYRIVLKLRSKKQFMKYYESYKYNHRLLVMSLHTNFDDPRDLFPKYRSFFKRLIHNKF